MKQSDHLDSQHYIQHNERVRQKIALESLRNQLKSQISQFKMASEPVSAEPEVNPETVYLEPRFFLAEEEQQQQQPAEKKKEVKAAETQTMAVVEEKVAAEKKEERPVTQKPKERKLETTTAEAVNKTVEVTCSSKEDGKLVENWENAIMGCLVKGVTSKKSSYSNLI